MLKLMKILSLLHLLSPPKLARLAFAIRQNGINLMLIFALTDQTNKKKTALVDSRESISYQELQERSESLAYLLAEKYRLGKNQRVAFLCQNHASLVQGIFAVSRLGADVYLLNHTMSQLQFDQRVEEYNYDLLIYDNEFSGLINNSAYRNPRIVSDYNKNEPLNTWPDLSLHPNPKLNASSSGKIVLLTGGTTGKPKRVVHRPSLVNFLDPFAALLDRLRLSQYSTAYIATPIYHGYGIAVLLAFFALGKKVIIQDSFEAKQACALVRHHQVEAITVVPLMLHKMMTHDQVALGSLRCIASGGAKLNPALVKEVNNRLGNVLYNLYGTSEAGLNIIAVPEDLNYHANTIGKAIKGGRLRVTREGKEVGQGNIGQLCIRNKWSMTNSPTRWIQTGDTGYQDANGYFFLCGRTDDLIISAGNNIYPLEIEAILTDHPSVKDAAVIGVEDHYSGQRLKAYVQLHSGKTLANEELLGWLETQLAKFQIPREIVFVDGLPYTALGKLDRKQVETLTNHQEMTI
ncbi:AMP-dependent synthetase [Planococcus maritimus]|uniref:AMP-binding protein n=1 Tax=Planococcus maritimus TaxID=192421 RepID=UPI00080F2207|nr:AMP-binding protein [Planococcus maritimus]ANU17156.1 AMP-dependent synthetase [Planococcus maritimus]